MFQRQTSTNSLLAYHNYLVIGKVAVTDGFIGINGDIQGTIFKTHLNQQRQVRLNARSDYEITPPDAAESFKQLGNLSPPVGFAVDEKSLWVQIRVLEGTQYLEDGREQYVFNITGFKAVRPRDEAQLKEASAQTAMACQALCQAKSAFTQAISRHQSSRKLKSVP